MRTSILRGVTTGLGVLAMAGVVGCGPTGVDPTMDQFDWSLTPREAQTAVGQLVNIHVTINTKSNINSDVDLQPGVVPDGLTVTLPTGMASTQQTADGTVYVSPAVEEGTYQVEIQAREVGGEFSTQQIQITVTNAGESADFFVEVDPQTYTMGIEEGTTFGYLVTPLNGFTGTVALSLAGLSDDLVLQTGPTPSSVNITGVGEGGTFQLRYLPHPPVTSPVQLVLTATSGTIVHTRTITLTLVPPPAAREVER